jgi:hypothetical protein
MMAAIQQQASPDWITADRYLPSGVCLISLSAGKAYQAARAGQRAGLCQAGDFAGLEAGAR